MGGKTGPERVTLPDPILKHDPPTVSWTFREEMVNVLPTTVPANVPLPLEINEFVLVSVDTKEKTAVIAPAEDTVPVMGVNVVVNGPTLEVLIASPVPKMSAPV